MSLESLRKIYGIPAFKNGRVEFLEKAQLKQGIILTSCYYGKALLIEVTGEGRKRALHPQGVIKYL